MEYQKFPMQLLSKGNNKYNLLVEASLSYHSKGCWSLQEHYQWSEKKIWEIVVSLQKKFKRESRLKIEVEMEGSEKRNVVKHQAMVL